MWKNRVIGVTARVRFADQIPWTPKHNVRLRPMDDLYVYHPEGGKHTPSPCTQCNRSIIDTFHRVNGAVICRSCRPEGVDQGSGDAAAAR